MNAISDECNHPLHVLFQPKAVAVIGVSKNPENPGNQFLRQLVDFPFRGQVYSVSLEEKEILGIQCHRTLREIRGTVDHVISCIPYHQVLTLVEDCLTKGVRCLHLYTARMAETQLKDRLDLERKIINMAREGGIRVIGPNCMGIYCPSVGLTFRHGFPKESGDVAFVSQSGGNAADLEYQGVGRGLRFSKIISFGNASDLNESDFLEYLLEDPQTKVIAMYLEGIKEGRRFLNLLRSSQGKKPIILFKAGRTQAGSRAVISHTASMSGEDTLWESICRQYGVVRVHSMREMADVLLTFQYLPPSMGKRVLVMGGGGGGSVAAADVCELEGFIVPSLTPEMRQEIRSFAPEVWSMISNPMDGSVMGSPEVMARSYKLGIQWDGVDLVIGNSSAIWILDHPERVVHHEMIVQFMIELSKETEKPMVIFVNAGDPTTPWRVEAVLKAQELCRDAGVPVYPNVKRAARALAYFTDYHRRMNSISFQNHD